MKLDNFPTKFAEDTLEILCNHQGRKSDRSSGNKKSNDKILLASSNAQA